MINILIIVLIMQLSIILTTYIPIIFNLLSPVTSELIRYSTLVGNLPQSLDLTTAEISHLNDVRLLYLIIQVLFFVGIGLLIYFLKRYRLTFLKHVQIKIFLILPALMIIFLLIGFFDFKLLFESMHYIIFPQGNWSFPASTSVLIQHFPLQLFVNLGVLFVIIYSIINIATILCLQSLKQKINKKS